MYSSAVLGVSGVTREQGPLVIIEGSMAPPSSPSSATAAAAAASVAAKTDAAVADIAAREAAAQADRDAQAAYLAAQAARADGNAERPYPGPFENLHREARGTRGPLAERYYARAKPRDLRADMGRLSLVLGHDF